MSLPWPQVPTVPGRQQFCAKAAGESCPSTLYRCRNSISPPESSRCGARAVSLQTFPWTQPSDCKHQSAGNGRGLMEGHGTDTAQTQHSHSTVTAQLQQAMATIKITLNRSMVRSHGGAWHSHSTVTAQSAQTQRSRSTNQQAMAAVSWKGMASTQHSHSTDTAQS